MLLGWLAVALAQDADLSRWVGLPLADVQLAGPEGGLPEESLAPLLRSASSAVLDPAALRLDVATLFQVGSYRSVEATVEPWFILDEDGNETDAVILTFVVYPAPRIEVLRLEGARSVRDRELLDASNLSLGQVYYDDLDGPNVAARVKRHLYQQGFTQAEVRTAYRDGELVITVDEGPANVLDRLNFAGDLAGVAREGQLRRWAARAGLREGRPFAPEAVGDARARILEEIGDPRAGLLRRRRGWVSARVSPVVINLPEGARTTFTIEPGPRLELEVTGLRTRRRSRVYEALAIDHRVRLTRGFVDEAPERVRAALARDGYFAAAATVALEVSDATQTLRVDIDRGARHTLKAGRFPNWIGVSFVGNAVMSDAELQAILDQASPDVVRQDVYVPEEVERGLRAAEVAYRSRGHLDAELRLEGDPRVRPRRGIPDLLRVMVGLPGRRRVQPTVSVDEGLLTRLGELSVEGAAVDLPDFEAERARLAGQPFSAQALDALSRQVLARHRDAGYLDADTRVVDSRDGDGVRSARIVVDPGEQILLRSVVLQGTRRSRPSFVLREVDLRLGEPIAPSELDAVRSRLYDLGTFATVRLDLLGDTAIRDLVVNVDERARWAFELGGGVNTDQGLRTFGRATRRNLFGRAHRLELVGQVGLDYRSESLRDWVPDVTDPEWRLAASYTAPHYPGRRQDLVFDVVLRERRQELTWQMDKTGSGIALEQQTQRLRLRAGARLEARQLQEVDPAALLAGEAWATLIGRDSPVLPSPWRVQESVQALAVLDVRDDPVRPTSGGLVSATGNWAPGIAWTDNLARTAFAKGELRASVWVPLFGWVLKASAEGGYALPLNGLPIPLEDRYRIGGTGSLRGFRRDAVGPRNIAQDVVVDWPAGLAPLLDYTRRDRTERWVPTGGDAMAVGSAELLMPFPALGLSGWDGYSLALFGDVGQAWLLSGGATASSDLSTVAPFLPAWRYGVGAGLRVATPIGPLQLDVAANPQVIQAEGAQRRLLNTLYEEPALRAHLTLGATF